MPKPQGRLQKILWPSQKSWTLHNCNKRGVEGGKKSKKSINLKGRNVCGGGIFFSKSVSVTSRLLER